MPGASEGGAPALFQMQWRITCCHMVVNSTELSVHHLISLRPVISKSWMVEIEISDPAALCLFLANMAKRTNIWMSPPARTGRYFLSTEIVWVTITLLETHGFWRSSILVSVGARSPYFIGPDNVGRMLSSGEDGLTAWKLKPDEPNMLAAGWDADMTYFFQKGFFTSISSDGAKPGAAIVGAVHWPTSKSAPRLALRAVDARDGATLVKGIPAGNWPNVIGAANAVTVAANGRIYVASNKALMLFGFGGVGACGVKVAAAAHAQFQTTLPLSGQFAVVKGTIVDVVNSKLHLKMRDEVVEVALSNVLATGRHGNLDPGKPVTIRGASGATGAMAAESIYSGD
jgi:hypothetical protein